MLAQVSIRISYSAIVEYSSFSMIVAVGSDESDNTHSSLQKFMGLRSHGYGGPESSRARVWLETARSTDVIVVHQCIGYQHITGQHF
nr:hypothetical protein CFP56_63462 [Quercus suber]